MRSTKFVQHGSRVLSSAIFTLCLATSLANVTRAANIAPLGAGILGVNNAVDNDAGLPYVATGMLAFINDNDVYTRVDNWAGNGTAEQNQPNSFVGIIWPGKRFESITTLSLNLATFWDGGWFGKNGMGPGNGGQLTAAYLIEPTVQVSADGGVTWTTVAHTSDYLTVMDGYFIGDMGIVNPTTATTVFTLQTPATQIDGIRIIGENGGTADGNGFLGIFELEVIAEASADGDGDGMPDAWEQAHGLNSSINDAAGDPDSDNLTNAEEYASNTDPQNADSDADGLKDGAEVKTNLTNPLLEDTDNDGLKDGREITETHTDPLVADTDEDGLSDGAEVISVLTNPLLADTDADGYTDSVEVSQGSDPLNPNSVPTNVALGGTGIMGTKATLDSEDETELYHSGVAASINDGNLSTSVDTYNGDEPGNVSFVGIRWDTQLTKPVVRLELTLATFYDGGWFGVNGTGPGAGARLTPAHLAEPRVEVQTSSSMTWTTVPHTSDYLATLDGHSVGGGLNPNPSKVTTVFSLNEPINDLVAIRLIGTDGGTASGGFLGVFELSVHIQGSTTADSDNDGIDDAWERQHGLVVGTNDSANDPDQDGLTNKQEFDADTDPKKTDTDSDGLPDGAELNQHQTDPLHADTDGDGLGDGYEVNTTKTDPTKIDTDGDKYSDPAEITMGTDPNSANSVPTDVALLGSGILGTKPTVDSSTETLVFNAGGPGAINDGNLTSRVDTWNGDGNTDTVSFVGILWDQPVTTPIVKLELSLAVFFDGGWFGVNGISPGSGGTLSASEHLVEPLVEVTTNKGTNWSAISCTSDYMQAMDGHPLPAADFGDPTLGKSTFVLTEPQAGINGIRLVGTEGGTASGGFLGVFELAVHTGAPVTIGLINAAIVNNKIQFEFDSVSGKSHVIQYTASLSTPNWQTLNTVAGDGTRKQATDNLSEAQRFYRVMTQ